MQIPSSNTFTSPALRYLLFAGVAMVSILSPVAISAAMVTSSPDSSPLGTVRIVEHSLDDLDEIKNSSDAARDNLLIRGLSASYGTVTVGDMRTFARTGTATHRGDQDRSPVVRSNGELTDQYLIIPGMGIGTRLTRGERVAGASLVADGEFRLESIGSIRHIFAHNNAQGFLALESIGEGDAVMYGETGTMRTYHASGKTILREDQLGVLARYPEDSIVLSTCDLADETLRTVIIFLPVSTP